MRLDPRRDDALLQGTKYRAGSLWRRLRRRWPAYKHDIINISCSLFYLYNWA